MEIMWNEVLDEKIRDLEIGIKSLKAQKDFEKLEWEKSGQGKHSNNEESGILAK